MGDSLLDVSQDAAPLPSPAKAKRASIQKCSYAASFFSISCTGILT